MTAKLKDFHWLVIRADNYGMYEVSAMCATKKIATILCKSLNRKNNSSAIYTVMDDETGELTLFRS